MLKDLKLVIFDLDGVLTETSEQHFLAWKALAAKHGIILPDSFEKNLKGVSREDSLKRILAYGNKSNSIPKSTFDAMMREKNTHYQSLIANFTDRNLFHGAKSLINLLKDKGLLLALGSASKNGPDLLKSLGIYDDFDYIVDPKGLKGKPAPDIFLEAMNHFNLAPENCIGIEDAIAGILAIKAANMTAIGIGDKKELNEADYIFKAIDEITESFIDRLLTRR
ncbi:MAG: beta-phosphoglucomutase [Candidatus Izemoplasmataceae bacterium]